MKKCVIYTLALLVGSCINCLIRKSVGLSTTFLDVLILNIIGLGSVWLYFTIKKTR